MDLLGAYADSDEEETPSIAPPTPQARPTTTTNATNSKKPGTKRKKKLDMSFLPPNIIEALARGDTLNDSDSDDEKKPRKTQNTAPTSSTTSSALLSKLPKPKNTYEAPGKSEVANMRVNISGPSYREDSDEEDEAIPGPALPTSSEQIPSYPEPIAASYEEPEISTYSATAYRSVNSAPVVEQDTLPPPGNLDAHYTSAAAPAPAKRTQQTKAKPTAHETRKRDREIQQELLRGNVAAVEFAGYVDVANPSEWDDTAYREQAQRQKELQTMFNFGQGAGENQIAQPSRVQNKKHQINSLALSAAQMELELMDARATRLRSKAETQAKYGW